MHFAGQSPPWRAEDPAPLVPAQPKLRAVVPQPPSEVGEAERVADIARRLADCIASVVRGKEQETKLVLTALACRGHVFLEDVPGTAKTVLARAIAMAIEGAEASRIQCTPDLLPTDVTGLSIYDQRTREFEFRPGPIVANVVLVDEINRAMPKTQSALLEAMAEQQVTVDGHTRELDDPFLLLATENPIEYEGTFPLPEAQLDRFLLKTQLGYPGAEDEVQILVEQRYRHPLGSLRPVLDVEIRGLSTMPPLAAGPEASRPYFRRLRELAERYGLPELSMGTTQDYRVAVEEGATMIRVGSALYRV